MRPRPEAAEGYWRVAAYPLRGETNTPQHAVAANAEGRGNGLSTAAPGVSSAPIGL
jgi:hypothetical protein